MGTNSDAIMYILHSVTSEMLKNTQNHTYTDLVSALEMSKRSHEIEVVKNQTLTYASTNSNVIYTD